MDYNLPGSSVHGIFQARIQEWVAVPCTKGSSKDQTCVSGVSCIGWQILYQCTTFQGLTWPESHSSSVQLCDPMDCSLLGSSVHGILLARILEWVGVPFSRRSSQSRDQTWVSPIAGGFFTSWATREAQEYWSGLPFPSPNNSDRWLHVLAARKKGFCVSVYISGRWQKFMSCKQDR